MALEPPLQVSETPQMRARIAALAQAEGISQAQVVRDILRIGIAQRESWSRELQHEALTPLTG